MIRPKILVPVCLTSNSNGEVLNAACDIAKKLNGKLTIVNIVNKNYLNIQERRDIEIELAQLTAKIYNLSSIPYEIIVTKGKLVKRIEEICSDFNMSLIILRKADIVNHNIDLQTFSVPLFAIPEIENSSINNLYLPLNINNSRYRSVISDITDIAGFFGANINVLAYSNYPINDIEILNVIKNEIERKNISCCTLFFKDEGEIKKYIEQEDEIGQDGVLIVSERNMYAKDLNLKSIILENKALPFLFYNENKINRSPENKLGEMNFC